MVLFSSMGLMDGKNYNVNFDDFFAIPAAEKSLMCQDWG